MVGSRASAIKSAARKTGVTPEEWRRRRKRGLLWCFACRRWRKRKFFCRDRTRKTGLACQCRDCHRVIVSATRYGISKDEVRRILAKGCGICGRRRNINIDHDHTTGRVRSALCARCNVALGLFRDDLALLKKAIKYVRSHAWANARK